jgi:hypothetical protein
MAARLNLRRLTAPYWRLLTVAFAAMLIEAAVDLLEPWPLKVVFDYVLGTKPPPSWLSAWTDHSRNPLAVLDAAVVAVVIIAVVGAVCSYAEKYLSTTGASGWDSICATCSITTCSASPCRSTSGARPGTWSFV